MGHSVPVRMDERLGGSLRRAPYVWLVATLLLYLVMNDPLARIASDSRHASPAVAIVGSAMIAYGIGRTQVSGDFEERWGGRGLQLQATRRCDNCDED